MISLHSAEKLIPRLEQHADWLKRTGRDRVASDVRTAAKILRQLLNFKREPSPPADILARDAEPAEPFQSQAEIADQTK